MSSSVQEESFYKVVKTSLKNILKNPEINLEKIQDAVIRMNKIMTHTLQFLKLFLLHSYEIGNFLLDKNIIRGALKTVSITNHKKEFPVSQELMSELSSFYIKNYLPLTWIDIPSRTNLKEILKYAEEEIITMYENNIKLHFVEYVEKYVNVKWKKKFIEEKIRKIIKTKKERESRIRKFRQELRKIKQDLLDIGSEAKYRSKIFYHEWIDEQIMYVLPPNKEFEENSIYYDLKCHPLDYLPCMIFMMKEIESEGEKIYNVFPMRTNIIPKYIKLDTTSLVEFLVTKEQGTKKEFKVSEREDDIWKFFFKTNNGVFRKRNYSFHHMILTDGIGVSIIFLKKEFVGRRVKEVKHCPELYVDDNLSCLKDKKIVGIDPGKEDLIYCVDGKHNHFRYSQNQRRKEMKSKKYRNIILGMKTQKIDNKTIIEYETELSEFNRKTLTLTNFEDYVREKNFLDDTLSKFYETFIFRKLKFGSFVNKQKSEERMMKNFKRIFGSPENVVVCFGDWEQKKQMKFKEPTKGKGMRSLFRKYKYKVFLVDEYRTSCRCFKCQGECKNCVSVKDPRPFKDGSLRLVHGLLRCKNVNCSCFWNRDCNGASNIYICAFNSINGLDRPEYLRRTNRFPKENAGCEETQTSTTTS